MTLLSFPPFVLISKMVMTAVSQNYGGKRKEGNDKLVKIEVYVKVYTETSVTVFSSAAISLKHPKMESRKLQATVRPFSYHRTRTKLCSVTWFVVHYDCVALCWIGQLRGVIQLLPTITTAS